MKKKSFKNKRAELQAPFSWMFAIIVGAIILFLAIYLSTRIIKVGDEITDARTGENIGILLHPMEMGFESLKVSNITFPVDTRIHNGCSRQGYFGSQLISVSQKSMNKWTDTNIKVSFPNKYIFSEKIVEGKKDFVFSKPFEFPFKVSDLIYMISYSDVFCFIDSPDKIQRELSQINSKNLKFENCSKDSNINVCFIQGSGCDIFVNYDSNYVEKKNTRMYFEGDALMYAGIFSEPELYECQVKRLMKKVEILSKIYLDKSSFIAREGCSSNLETELIGIGSAAGSLENSFGLKLVSIIAEEAGKKNYANVECRLW